MTADGRRVVAYTTDVAIAGDRLLAIAELMPAGHSLRLEWPIRSAGRDCWRVVAAPDNHGAGRIASATKPDLGDALEFVRAALAEHARVTRSARPMVEE